MENETKKQIERIKASGLSKEDKERHIACAKERAKEQHILTHASREERLKAIYRKYIDLAVDFAKMFGSMKETTGGDIKELKRELKFELTMALKKAKVLPLGN